ncbi:hypothetical protein MJO28_002105 [Puccinia striiformis f. sp. tritici]|uniref:Uncharacterized protein n=1 Tax=Puccinia striiformis f. sp. tritici TaxID=168172 RepID=A0ACC0EVV5_9BASI|nr:hypothetical protein MJO28_002105 [Puccinia striiformis f. sp. tritici]KAI7966431.1 hypothetical protein MJO29_002179 [Puccinia striiformis f. sp. tritici]
MVPKAIVATSITSGTGKDSPNKNCINSTADKQGCCEPGLAGLYGPAQPWTDVSIAEFNNDCTQK